jgi:hypothetical protein
MIRPEDQRLLQPFLLPGERLLWAGRPRGGLIFRSADLYLIPLSLFFEAVALSGLARQGDDPVFAAISVFVAGVPGLYFIAGRFLHDAWRRAGLLYAVSNRRVILLETRGRRRLRSLDIGHLPMLLLDQHGADRGTLRFDVEKEDIPNFRIDFQSWMPAGSRGTGFEEIDQPQMVYDLIAKESDRRRRELFGAAVDDPLFLG